MKSTPFLIYTLIILISFIPVAIIGSLLQLKTLIKGALSKDEALGRHSETSYPVY